MVLVNFICRLDEEVKKASEKEGSTSKEKDHKDEVKKKSSKVRNHVHYSVFIEVCILACASRVKQHTLQTGKLAVLQL